LKILLISALLSVSFSSQAFVIGEYRGIGQYKDNNANINAKVCSVAINVNYNEQEKLLRYEYADLCRIEPSSPSNDFNLNIKVDDQDKLYIVSADNSLVGPVGVKKGNEFNFSFKITNTILLKWTPQNIQNFINGNHGNCPLIDSESVKIEKELSYRFVLNGANVTYERSSKEDMLPIFMSKKCNEENVGTLSKFNFSNYINAELTRF
jgi:hypothetical protein